MSSLLHHHHYSTLFPFAPHYITSELIYNAQSLSPSTPLQHHNPPSEQLPHLASVTSQPLLNNTPHNPSATHSYALSALPQPLQPSNHSSSLSIYHSTTLHPLPIYTTASVLPLPLLPIVQQQPSSSLFSPLLHHHRHVQRCQCHVIDLYIYISTAASYGSVLLHSSTTHHPVTTHSQHRYLTSLVVI